MLRHTTTYAGKETKKVRAGHEAEHTAGKPAGPHAIFVMSELQQGQQGPSCTHV
jgi:hypothetical protein